MIALSLVFATAIWSLGSFVLTCVGTEESRVDGVELDAIDAAARLAIAGLEVDKVVVVDVLVGQLQRRRQVLGELN